MKYKIWYSNGYELMTEVVDYIYNISICGDKFQYQGYVVLKIKAIMQDGDED